MKNEIVESTNVSSIFDILTIFVQNSLLLFADIDRETFGLFICAFFVIIGATTYIFQKVKDKKNININNADSLMKDKEFEKYSPYKTRSDNYDYHKILSEFHNVSNNCSNIFSSMKCVQLASNYPELINVKLFSDGVTPFHRVCFHGNEPLIEFMLAKGADPELKTIAGENALCMTLYYYLYTESKDFSSLNILHKKGCHLSYTDEWYEIFSNLAIKSKNKYLIMWLLTHSKPPGKKSFTRASSVPLQ